MKTEVGSVTDTVKMFAVRKIGKNVHYSNLTFWIEQADDWVKEGEEIVTVEIKPYRKGK